jgi:G3E family GTPase
MMPRIPTTVLSGYLGSGKTTVINGLLAEVEDRHIAVLVNDFGSINIDASLIRNQSDQTVSLTNGCVCCSIADDLGGAIDAQVQRSDPPEHIVIEASGVADTQRLAQHTGGWPGTFLSRIVCVVDAETIVQRTEDKFVGSLVRRQLGAAGVLILNKMDLLDTVARSHRREWLKRHVPGAPVIETMFGTVSPELLVPPAFSEHSQQTAWPLDSAETHGHLASAVWTAALAVDVTRLRRVLDDLPESIHRLKGFIVDANTGEVCLVQRTGRRLEITPVEEDKASAIRSCACQLVLIGSCEQHELRRICDQLGSCAVGGDEASAASGGSKAV